MFCNHNLINKCCYLILQTEDDVKTAPSLDSLDLGFPEDDEENQSDSLCLLIVKLKPFLFM